jgi:hypothetical protein
MPAFDIIKADKDDQSSRSRDITVAFAGTYLFKSTISVPD